MMNKSETGHGTGGFISEPDKRDYRFEKHSFVGGGAFKWETGYDIEEVLGFKLRPNDQGDSFSCFPGKTPVLMEDFSYKNISSITKGDVVLSHLGIPRKVNKVYQRKWQGTMTRLKMYGDFREIESTNEHPYLVKKRGEKYSYPIFEYTEEPKWINAKDIEKGDFVGMPFNNIVRDTTINSFEKDPDFLWLLGLYLAEGSTSKYITVLSVHKDETHFLNKAKNIMNKYGANVTHHFKKNSKSLSINIHGEKWANVFRELGGSYCDKKKINTRLLFLEPYLQMQIYNGWNDGDGRKGNKSHSVVTTSYELVLQMRTILLRNGIFSSLQKRNDGEHKKQAYTLEHSETSRYSFIKDNICWVQIKSTVKNQYFQGENVYNLEVDVDNTYQVNGVIVHNCGGQAWSKYGSVLEYLKTRTYEERSAKFIYSQIFYPAGGSTGRDNCKIATKKGFCLESIVPSYENGKPPSEAFMRRINDLTAEAFSNALGFKTTSFYSLKKNIEDVAAAISTGYGCVIGINGKNNGTWHSQFPKPDKNHEWGHWVYAGKAKMIDGKRYIGILNSWGYIGDNGWQWISEDFFTQGLIIEGWVIIHDERLVELNILTSLKELLETLLSLSKKAINGVSNLLKGR